jgi:hypothetical protein
MAAVPPERTRLRDKIIFWLVAISTKEKQLITIPAQLDGAAVYARDRKRAAAFRYAGELHRPLPVRERKHGKLGRVAGQIIPETIGKSDARLRRILPCVQEARVRRGAFQYAREEGEIATHAEERAGITALRGHRDR